MPRTTKTTESPAPSSGNSRTQSNGEAGPEPDPLRAASNYYRFIASPPPQFASTVLTRDLVSCIAGLVTKGSPLVREAARFLKRTRWIVLCLRLNVRPLRRLEVRQKTKRS